MGATIEVLGDLQGRGLGSELGLGLGSVEVLGDVYGTLQEMCMVYGVWHSPGDVYGTLQAVLPTAML